MKNVKLALFGSFSTLFKLYKHEKCKARFVRLV